MSINHVARIRQTERLVAAFRPVDAALGCTRPASAPLAKYQPIVPAPASSWEHGFCRIDGSGRIRDAVLFNALGWSPGMVVEVTLTSDKLTVAAGAAGGQQLDARGRITLSDCHRTALGLTAGSGVLLVGDPLKRIVYVLPVRSLDRLVVA